MRTGTGAGTEARAVEEMGTGTRMGTEMGTRTGSWRVEEKLRSATNLTRVVDAMWETGDTWLGGMHEQRRQERVGSVAADEDILEKSKKARRSTKYPGLK